MVCVRACVCVCKRPCVLTLPIVFTATRPAICSETQTQLCVLLRAVAGSSRVSAVFPPPLLRPSISCFSSVSSWLSNSGVLFSFQWGVR